MLLIVILGMGIVGPQFSQSRSVNSICDEIVCGMPPCLDGTEPVIKPGDCCPTCPEITEPKPDILVTGICASSPNLPCCKETQSTFELLSGPAIIMDLVYPSCRTDGYYKPKQCSPEGGCMCVDRNGETTKVPSQTGYWEAAWDIQCSDKRAEPADLCASIACGWPRCPDGATPVTKEGHCCPSCPEPKPDILVTGICPSSPDLPCCKETQSTYELLSGPAIIMDLVYPSCRTDGYYEPKQCSPEGGCVCVDQNGKTTKVPSWTGDWEDAWDIQCSEKKK